MKNTILKYGAIAGLITTGMMIISTTMHNQNPDFKGSEIIGFAGMFIAFIFIFIGIKSFRDKQNNGVISFGTGFKFSADRTCTELSMLFSLITSVRRQL